MVLSEELIIKRLKDLDQSSECIQTASMYLLHHKDSIDQIVKTWLEVFKTGITEHRVQRVYQSASVLCVLLSAERGRMSVVHITML